MSIPFDPCILRGSKKSWLVTERKMVEHGEVAVRGVCARLGENVGGFLTWPDQGGWAETSWLGLLRVGTWQVLSVAGRASGSGLIALISHMSQKIRFKYVLDRP